MTGLIVQKVNVHVDGVNFDKVKAEKTPEIFSGVLRLSGRAKFVLQPFPDKAGSYGHGKAQSRNNELYGGESHEIGQKHHRKADYILMQQEKV